jgi:hypothetical protein
VKAEEKTELHVELRISSKSFNHTPDVTLAKKSIKVDKGEQTVQVDFDVAIPHDTYAFVCFMKNNKIELMFSPYLITGVLSVFNRVMPAVSNWGKQTVTEDIGIDEFEFWCPERRPDGQNIAMKISPAINSFGASNLLNIINRPVEKANAWVAALDDRNASLTIDWSDKVEVSEITLFMDTDWDHPMESVQWGHSDNRMPFCADQIKVYDDQNKLLAENTANHQTLVMFTFEIVIKTKQLALRISNSSDKIPTALFGIIILINV